MAISGLSGTHRLVMSSKIGLPFMKTILKKLVSLCFLLVLGITHADSQTSSLTVKPDRCIGLQQGQTCFTTLKFKWTTPAAGEFCLFDERSTDPLVCWVGDSKTSFSQPFESNLNVIYEIRLKSNDEPLAQVLVKVSWVYKSNLSTTSRWRLF
jgi:hypothetical protein